MPNLKEILLIIVGLSVALLADFSRDDGTQIVTDNITKLQWQDDDTVSSSRKSWIDALAYCEESTLGGHNDWRLPNIKELISIVDDTRFYPGIDTDAFKHVTSQGCWASTTYAGNSSYAWGISFHYGRHYYDDKSTSGYVRCVRAGQ
jgi:hypothetical protein